MAAATTSAYRIRAGVLALRTTVVCLAVGWVLFLVVWFTGIGGGRVGWLWTAALVAPIIAVAAWVSWGDHTGRQEATAVLVVLSILVSVGMARGALISHRRLEVALEAIVVASDFEHVGDSTAGTTICLSICKENSRTWVVARSADDARNLAVELLMSDAFVLDHWMHVSRGPDYLSINGRRKHPGVRATVDGRSEGRDHPPAGHVFVTVSLGTA